MLQCDECGKWRLLYSQKKLNGRDRCDLQSILEDISLMCMWCTATGRLCDDHTREMCCKEPIEKLYYSAKYEPICIYCAEDVDKV